MKASQVKKGWRRSACAAIVGLAMLVLPAAAPAGQVPPGSPEDVGLSSERLERIGEAMERHIEAGNITGAVTLVAPGARARRPARRSARSRHTSGPRKRRGRSTPPRKWVDAERYM